MNNRQIEIRRRLNLPAYLRELEAFCGRQVGESELTLLEFVEEFRRKVEAIPKTHAIKFTIPFNMRTSSKFASLINQLRDLNPESIYLWTSRSNDCGLFKLMDISKVNFDFPFDANTDGMLVIATTDGLDRMLLDFSEEDSGGQLLEVELYGQNWSKASIPFV